MVLCCPLVYGGCCRFISFSFETTINHATLGGAWVASGGLLAQASGFAVGTQGMGQGNGKAVGGIGLGGA